jgi:hypothetical protein
MSDDSARKRALLAVLGIPYLALVLTEFLLGMGLALFVTLPAGSPVQILESAPLLDVHFAVGFLLLGIAARTLALSVTLRDRRAVGFTALGLVSGVGAFVAGLDFAFGGQSASASYVMSVGFVGLLTAAAYLLWRRADSLADGPNQSSLASG